MTLTERLAKLRADAEAILLEQFGQCEDYCHGCPTCDAWRALNEFCRVIGDERV